MKNRIIGVLLFCSALSSCSVPSGKSEGNLKTFQGTCNEICITAEVPERFKGNTFQVNYRFSNMSSESKTVEMLGCSLNPAPTILAESGALIVEDAPGCIEQNELSNLEIEPGGTEELVYDFALKEVYRGVITVETQFVDGAKFSWDRFLAQDYDDMIIGEVAFHIRNARIF